MLRASQPQPTSRKSWPQPLAARRLLPRRARTRADPAGEYRDSMTEPGAPGGPGAGRQRRQSPVVAVILVLIAAAVLSTATLLAARWVFSPPGQPAPTRSAGVGFVRLDRQARPVSLPSLHGSAM